MRTTQTWPPATAQPAAPEAATKPAPGRLVGYGRVSKAEQHASVQAANLKAAGCDPIYLDEGVSGKLASRPELDKCLAALQAADVLVVWKLDRLGRSVQHLVEVISTLRERGVGFRSLTESLDTTTNGGMLIFHIFAAIAEFERGLIVERTMAGLEAAAANGHHGGRKPALNPEREDVAMAMVGSGKTITAVAEGFGVSRSVIYRAAHRRGILEPSDGYRRGGRPPIPAENTAEGLRMLHEGATIRAAARAARMSDTTLLRKWRESGETEPPPGVGQPASGADDGWPMRAMTREQARLGKQLLGDGESVAAVARSLGVARATLTRAVELLGGDG